MPASSVPADPGRDDDLAWLDRDPMTAQEREEWLDRVCEHDEPPKPEEYEDFGPLPTEELASAAGQFAAGQPLDAATAGPGLATALAGTLTELGSLSDDALAGFLGGCQKIAAWSAGMLLDGIAEFAGRRPDDGTPGRAALYAAAARKARQALAAGEPADRPGV